MTALAEPSVRSRAELWRALAACIEHPTPQLTGIAAALGLPAPPTAAAHTETFTLQLYPYASVHLDPSGQLGGIARDRVAGFLRALDVTPPADPDHLVVLLGAYAQLLELDGGPGSRARLARTVLLHEHLWSWAPRFLVRVSELGGAFHRAWADLLLRALTVEIAAVGAPEVLSAHLREAPSLPDPRDGDVGGFVGGLFAPVRSGVVLTRADLGRAARALGLGLRVGERAYLLRALLAQDAPATLRFLADECRRQSTAVVGTDVVADFWSRRAETTARLLDGLAAEHAATSDQG